MPYNENMNKKTLLYLIIILVVVALALMLTRGDSSSTNLSTDVVATICSQESPFDEVVNVVNSSSDGEYYELSYASAVYDSEGNVIGVNPILDNPGEYYDSSGTLVGNCGGLLNEESSSFCIQTLPSLTFDTTNLCL